MHTYQHRTYETKNNKITKHAHDHKTLMYLYQQSQPMNVILEPTNGFGGLYLGNMEAAQNYSILHREGIKAVLTVASRTNLRYNENIIPYHEVIVCDDCPEQNLSQYFDQMYNFIDKQRKNTNVFIHCMAGISRSATAVIMYLMKKNKWSYEKAFFHCRQKRKVINPNPGFIKQLLDFEMQLADSRASKDVQKQKKKVGFKIDEKIESIKQKEDFQNRQTLYREQQQRENKDVYESMHNDRLQQFKQEQEQKLQRCKMNTPYNTDNNNNQQNSYLDPLNNKSNNLTLTNPLSSLNQYQPQQQQLQQQQDQSKSYLTMAGRQSASQQGNRHDAQIENRYQKIKEAENDSKNMIQQQLYGNNTTTNNTSKNNALYQKYQAIDSGKGDLLDKYSSFRNIYSTQANSSYGRYQGQQAQDALLVKQQLQQQNQQYSYLNNNTNNNNTGNLGRTGYNYQNRF